MVFVTLIVIKTNRRTLLLKGRREIPRAGARWCKPTRPRTSSPPSSYRTVSDALILVFSLITVFVVVIVVIVGVILFFPVAIAGYIFSHPMPKSPKHKQLPNLISLHGICDGGIHQLQSIWARLWLHSQKKGHHPL